MKRVVAFVCLAVLGCAQKSTESAGSDDIIRRSLETQNKTLRAENDSLKLQLAVASKSSDELLAAAQDAHARRDLDTAELTARQVLGRQLSSDQLRAAKTIVASAQDERSKSVERGQEAHEINQGTSAVIEALAVEGVNVYRRLVTTYKYTGLYLVGGVEFSGKKAPPPAALEFAIPAEAWARLSDRERATLSYFVESQVAVVRAHPDIYSLDPSSAPLWPSMQRTFESICDTCWSIKLGRHTSNTGGVVSADRTPVAGDDCFERGACSRPETTAAELRRKAFKTDSPPLAWAVPRLDPTTKYRIDREATSTFDAASQQYIHLTPADLAGAWRNAEK